MKTYLVTFFINNIPIEDADLRILAFDREQAQQVLNLKLNTGKGVPSIWNSYEIKEY